MTACRKCGWTSGKQVAKDAADGMGKFHEQDNPGHGVVLKEVPNGESATRKRPVGETL